MANSERILAFPSRLRRGFAVLLAVLTALLAAPPATAKVVISFHSFNGSWLVGRFPHAFVALDGTLDSTGEVIHQNFGYSARHVSPAVLTSNVESEIYIEKQHYVDTTNVHFRLPISDEQYHAVIAEVDKWRNETGKAYSLDHHNCVHFVAAIAEVIGIKAPVPQDMVRRPKKWLNYITSLNPWLDAKPIK